MSLVTIQEYRDITKDISTPAEEVSAKLEESTDLVEEYLQRTLEYGTYTEALEVWSDESGTYVYPLVTPLVGVPANSSYAIDHGNARITNIWNDLDAWDLGLGVGPGSLVTGVNGVRPVYATITYDGGYTVLTAPKTLKRGIARVARGLIVVNPQRLVGATSISVGDVSVSYPAYNGEIDMLVPGVGLSLKAFKRKRLRY